MEKYYEIIEEMRKEKIDDTKLYLLSSIHSVGNFEKEKEIEIMNLCYDFWLDIDADISLGRLVDVVIDNLKDIENDELDKYDIAEMCINI